MSRLKLVMAYGALMTLVPMSFGAEETAGGIALFRAAYAEWDGAGFERAASHFEADAGATALTSTNAYWLGVAQFHSLLYLQGLPVNKENKEAAQDALKQSIDTLETAVSLDARNAETHALLGVLYGMRIGKNLFRAARFGPRVEEHRKQAMLLGPSNPRVAYLLGTCQFHTGKRKEDFEATLETLLKSEQLFQDEAAKDLNPWDPRWGRASCLMFIGLTYEQLGENDKALDYFERTIRLQPGNQTSAEALKRAGKAANKP